MPGSSVFIELMLHTIYGQLQYGQIRYIRVYEKSNLKRLSIGNLYVKLLAVSKKKTELSQEKSGTMFFKAGSQLFSEFRKKIFTIIVILKMTTKKYFW